MREIEIESAAHEQHDGVGQIDQAVLQIDKVTQDNAALVEEHTLHEAVAVFRPGEW